MGEGTFRQAAALERTRQLGARLRRRKPELEEALLSRVTPLLRSEDNSSPQYVVGVRDAISTGIDYVLEILDTHRATGVVVPSALLSQARLAAGSGVQLDRVLSRYSVGYNLLVDEILAEAANDATYSLSDVQKLIRHQAVHFESLVQVISTEYRAECARRSASPTERQAARVRALLAGQLIDMSDLAYELESRHLGLIAEGISARLSLRQVCAEFRCQLLVIPGPGKSLWAWFGGGHGDLSSGTVEEALRCVLKPKERFCLGEPASGVNGWRQTHGQALALHAVSQRQSESVLRYADQALVASMAQDRLLMASLQQIYLAPLEVERDGGERLKATLRAYFDARGQVSSAAAALSVSRKTVRSHIARVEEHLGRSLTSCMAELQAALTLDHAVGLPVHNPKGSNTPT